MSDDCLHRAPFPRFWWNNSNYPPRVRNSGRIIESNTNSERNESTAMTSSLDETSTREIKKKKGHKRTGQQRLWKKGAKTNKAHTCRGKMWTIMTPCLLSSMRKETEREKERERKQHIVVFKVFKGVLLQVKWKKKMYWRAKIWWKKATTLLYGPF